MNYKTIIIASITILSYPAVQARDFAHPGISYTRSDLDRMKAMVEAGVEPYSSTFEALKESRYSSLTATATDRGTNLREGKFNGTIGADGRRAHDLALLWHLTGDESYARKAVEFINANSHYISSSARGTGPLDNGKIYLLIEAAELMRDYTGWSDDDKKRFADMLVYPRYSYSEDLYKRYATLDDETNGITFYWNIYNFDAGRHGNQGLFAARAMMAMGIFLDNEKIYDRALRYIMALPHRSDDLPYPPGPPVVESNKNTAQSTATMNVYSLKGRRNDIEDYGYDEQLRHYIYANGQTQEACRDQGHALVGVQLFVDLAEMAWNQGDNLYGALDNRILTGLEWTFRYNLSSLRSYPEQTSAWEPSGYTSDESEVSFDNGLFLRTHARSGRWESIGVSPDGRGDNTAQGGSRECALAHYSVRAGLPEDSYTWLRRYRNYMTETYGHESWGKPNNWYYEWKGWGTLTKRLPEGMRGEAARFSDGHKISGIHTLPGSITAGDYDYFCPEAGGAQDHTCFSSSPVAPGESAYRSDGGMNIDGHGAVRQLSPGDYMTYTVSSSRCANYWVTLNGENTAESCFSVAVADGTYAASENGCASVVLPAGASTLTIRIDRCHPDIKIEEIRISSDHPSGVKDNIVAADDHLPAFDLAGRRVDEDSIPKGTIIVTEKGKFLK